jgi:hypothetical protein
VSNTILASQRVQRDLETPTVAQIVGAVYDRAHFRTATSRAVTDRAYNRRRYQNSTILFLLRFRSYNAMFVRCNKLLVTLGIPVPLGATAIASQTRQSGTDVPRLYRISRSPSSVRSMWRPATEPALTCGPAICALSKMSRAKGIGRSKKVHRASFCEFRKTST